MQVPEVFLAVIGARRRGATGEFLLSGFSRADVLQRFTLASCLRNAKMQTTTEAKPCEKFPKIKLTREFVAHLPTCDKCRAALTKLESESQSDAVLLKRAS
jgi:hypothetical protein